MRPTGKSLVLDLLSTVRRGPMPVRALVAAAALFGIEENALRVALARLLAAGRVERDERGRYRLGARAAAVSGQIAGWRALEERVRPWDGGWVGAHAVTGPAGRRALRFLGFRRLAAGLGVRPDNLAGGVAAVREQLESLGLPRGTLVGGLRDLDEATDARARRLWDVGRLRAAYRESRAALAESERGLARLAPARAMVESFLLGGRVIRQLVLDPLLPEPIVPAGERAALVAAMREYDRVGRAAWAAFMRDFEVVPHGRAPMDLRIVDGAGPLAAAGGST